MDDARIGKPGIAGMPGRRAGSGLRACGQTTLHYPSRHRLDDPSGAIVETYTTT
ncbi:hypothetical protein ACQPZP_41005 [Spirillospora sp. CA-142024]|uniref:hypothetical protein n=1 Tax=Spirillospora sp. CA-142024 TaxID=3240036 RepID=UPI003D942994